ncbi:carbon-nitrogen hydrolase family protein [Jannaschia sp. Os4]|uniref:carbon-nitrogen hydrolase family protein n=1 Tax=Jannaschia sp. Os4 TaxID=2807617 RepID=UPI001939F7E6|nr:carbon-nitrogen hydrolase family protein [Jannaschia sp. Os4]MBM2575191.1 carbon-nitrogen hydrolase family protein [Jannaschia sp. Os4]
MRAALCQMSSSDDPAENAAALAAMLDEAAEGGAGWALTPEVTNCVSGSRTRQRAVLGPLDADPCLLAARAAASRHGMWVLLGSLAVTTEDADGRFANRSVLIGADGTVAATYDKIHMFDVEIDATETYRESSGYRPGDRAVAVDAPWGRTGLTICYDLRFPALHRALAQAGARILTVPAAFSPVTGAAHWEVLLRARAIETGCWILAPAQTGAHPATRGRPRRSHGHSLAVAPWGEVVLDAGTGVGVAFVDLYMDAVDAARRRVPSLAHDRRWAGP